jgi:hypothetical protein
MLIYSGTGTLNLCLFTNQRLDPNVYFQLDAYADPN